MPRAILFVEVPHFYAAVERADDPALAERPVIVGGDPRKGGVVQAATPDALAAGVQVDMPVLAALGLCPRARSVRTDMRRYREVSRRLLAELRRGLGPLEVLGLGAGWCDLPARGAPGEPEFAALVERVRAGLGLELRGGIAPGKYLARLAAEGAAPGRLRQIAPGEQEAFLRPLAVTRLEGVGQKTAGALAELGARCIGDVVALGREPLERALGNHGVRIHALACGVDDAPVRAARHPQSLSRESVVDGGALDVSVLSEHLQELCRGLEGELRLEGLCAGRVTLKIRYADQSRTTRSTTLSAPVAGAAELHGVASDLLARTQAGSRPLRGLGVQVAKLAPEAEGDRQLDLFPTRS